MVEEKFLFVPKHSIRVISHHDLDEVFGKMLLNGHSTMKMIKAQRLPLRLSTYLQKY